MRRQALKRGQDWDARRQQEGESGAAMALRCLFHRVKELLTQLTLLKLAVRAAEGFSPVDAAQGQHQACCLHNYGSRGQSKSAKPDRRFWRGGSSA
jgi:hypothetical protein